MAPRAEAQSGRAPAGSDAPGAVVQPVLHTPDFDSLPYEEPLAPSSLQPGYRSRFAASARSGCAPMHSRLPARLQEAAASHQSTRTTGSPADAPWGSTLASHTLSGLRSLLS